jgi:tetratricopeptide (TPR) repeat protein
MKLRDRLEEYQMRGVRHQLAIAEQRDREDPSEDTKKQVKRFKSEINRLELDVYAKRCERSPDNGEFRYELGVRLKRASQFKEAIKNLQQARTDSMRKASVHLELGECFQYIKQYKLALANYDEAIKHCSEKDPDTLKKALYRGGVLASGMKETDTAKRYLTNLANLDFGYRDVADRLDKLS